MLYSPFGHIPIGIYFLDSVAKLPSRVRKSAFSRRAIPEGRTGAALFVQTMLPCSALPLTDQHTESAAKLIIINTINNTAGSPWSVPVAPG